MMVHLAAQKKWRRGQPKMPDTDVKAVRRYAKRKIKPKGWKSGLARMYNVSPGCISDILSERRRA